MKKIFFAIFVFVLAGCNNDSENNNSEDTTINHNSGVENVNGNIPDTANTITLEGITSEKSTTADTTKKN
jgi:ABC-type Fe3+-citrate transport system substrate-binding protein